MWVALLVLALRYAPAASYLVSVPLLAVIALVTPSVWLVGSEPVPRTWPARVGSILVVVITWMLWAPDLLTLLPFAVTLLGRMPIVTPTWAYPAVFFLAGIVLWPPVLAVLVGRMRWRVAHGIAAGTLMFALVVTGVLAWVAPAFTVERPQQRSALFVDDRIRGAAHWELHGNEPGVDIGAGGPANVAWQIAERSSVPGSEIDPKAHLFRASVPPPATAVPATITATIVRRPGDADVEITVTPRDAEWQAVAIVLPESIVPTRSTLAGRTRGGRWQAWHTTMPRDGITWRGHGSGKPGRSTRGHRGLGGAGAPPRCRRRRARTGMAARATHGVDDATHRDAAAGLQRVLGGASADDVAAAAATVGDALGGGAAATRHDAQRPGASMSVTGTSWLDHLGLGRPELRAWAFYDWANSAFLTTIVAAVFPVYYNNVAAKGLAPETAAFNFSMATTIALAVSAVIAPVLGAIADHRPYKKLFLVGFMLIGVIATMAMAAIGEGDWALAIGLFMVANVAVSGSIAFYDSLLPHIAAPDELDKVSSSGFAIGYLGGGLLLLVNLAWILQPHALRHSRRGHRHAPGVLQRRRLVVRVLDPADAHGARAGDSRRWP